MTRICPQCYKDRPVGEFLSEKKGAQCQECRAFYAMPADIRPPRTWRRPAEPATEVRVRFSLKSNNQKTGPIPVSTSSPETCPPSCSWYGRGCYAEHHYIGHRWRKVNEDGLTWEEFLERVRALPEGQLWRHNEAGDLPGIGENLDYEPFYALLDANAGRRGFTFTHKSWRDYYAMIEIANESGFTINISCDSIEEVDAARRSGLRAPLTVVVADTSPARFRTPEGAHVITCPAQLRDISCKDCQLCANPRRKSVIAFRAHGQSRARMGQDPRQLHLPILGC